MVADLSGKVAVVTGGAGGLGAATCRALKAAGARVVVADIDERGATTVVNEVGGRFQRVDVASFEDNVALMQSVVDNEGGIDLVFLNAGVATYAEPGAPFDPARYRRAMAINLDGVVYGAEAALPHMRARGGGSIVATASLAGLTGVPMDPYYCANKHGVVGLVRSLGPAWSQHDVRVNAVCPGFAESAIVDPIRDMLALSGIPLIDPIVVANTVVQLFAGDMTGECWWIQPGREPEPFAFRNLPGPRATTTEEQ
jgi:NAD(P)-dependent dehydrogenase (short-subunit alcohol dehydrogenase family)